MKGSRTIKRVQVNSIAKITLLAFIVSCLVSVYLIGSAFAAELFAPSSNPQNVIASSFVSPLDGYGRQADSDVSHALAVFDTHLDSSSQDSSIAAGQSQKIMKQDGYVSVRGYSAFNHFSLALKAMIAAVGVMLIGLVGFYVYRRHKNSQEELPTKSVTYVSTTVSNKPESVEE